MPLSPVHSEAQAHKGALQPVHPTSVTRSGTRCARRGVVQTCRLFVVKLVFIECCGVLFAYLFLAVYSVVWRIVGIVLHCSPPDASDENHPPNQ